MKIRSIISILIAIMLVCSVLPMSAGAYAVADGAEKSYEAAAEAMVLLKNDNNALPLTSADKIALFGEGQVYTDGKTGGFFLMGRGSGYFVPSETPKNPCDVLASYVSEGKLGGVYTALCDSYKAAAVTGEDFSYSPTDAEYTAAAEYANKAVYIVNRTSSEGADISKANFFLTTAEQNELKKICAAFDGKPVIVVLDTGSMINCGFANGRVDGIYADAVITATYLGIRGVDALCGALVGDINPSGKTVDTYAKTLEDYPSYNGFYESKDYTTYYEDIYTGYRYFETFNVDVDYPFGYGLSYTTFDISDVTYSEKDGEITVTAKITNTGDVAGKEVLQVYFGAPQKGTGGAVLSKASKELCGFAKTSLLGAGESEILTVTFAIDDMASYDDLGATGHKSAYVMEAGDYTVYAGNSVRNTVVAGKHTENALRVVEQLSELCEPTVAFERMTYDGTETVGEASSFRSDLLHVPTEAKQTNPQTPIKFVDTLNGSATVDEFLAQMSNEELATMAMMTNASPTNTGAWGASAAVAEKYSMPLSYTCDGPAGIRHATKGTGLPCATALACTWNAEAVAALGDVIGRECAMTDIDVWLAPAVNLHHYPLCGRNFEYFSEDPYISGVMAAELIKGVEANGIACSIKHFIANEKEQNRMQVDSRMSERALREIYLTPFKMAVDAGVSTVMTSYNFLNGTETSEHTELLRGILRGEWGFDGLITTDWSNDSNLAKEVIAGNNVHSSMHYGADGSAYEYHMDNKYIELMEGVENGTVSRSLLIENATYVMNLLENSIAADRLEAPEVWTVNASGESKFEAEDYTLKHGYARPEKSGSRTSMSYVRGTKVHVPYLTYTLDVEKSGTYILTTSYANATADPNTNALRVFVNGEEQLVNYNATATGGWSKYTDAEIGAVTLPKGTVELKIKSVQNIATGNFDYFILTPIEEAYTAISTPEELIALMGDSTMWSGSYYLANDIDLTDVAGQGPIGTTATKFTGKFDGMGHSVKGLDLTTSTEQDFGLFGKIMNARIRNLTVYGAVTSTVSSNAVVGGIVGTLDPDSFVVNCTNYANVTYNNTTKAAKGVGGVAGYLYAGSTNTGTVVTNCTNYGAVNSISGGKEAVAGGIAGILHDNGAGITQLKYCQNFGDVYGEGIKVGGIVGYIAQAAAGGGAEVAYCANHGDVTAAKGTQARMGGIVGYANSASETDGKEPNITFCINYGNVTTDISYESAGVLGYNVGVNVDNCVNLGTLTALDSATTEKPMGGVVGKTFTSKTAIVYEITNCYTTSVNIIPDVGYEKPDYFKFTSCGVVSESDLINGNTTLTFGEEGYTVVGDALMLSVFAPVPEEDEGINGDLNGDGTVTVTDALMLISAVVNDTSPKNGDVNGDGRINLADVIRVMRIAAGEEFDDTAEKEVITVACVGDSITHGTGSTDSAKYSYPARLQELLGDGYEVVNCGKPSSYVMRVDSPYNTKKDSPQNWYPNTAEYTELMSCEPDIIIVMLGTNDARSMTDPAAIDDFVSAYKALISDFASIESNPEIYLSSMIPATGADILNQGTVDILPKVIEEIADELELTFVPTHEILHDYYSVMLDYNDKVHPNKDSYPALAANFCREVFGKDVALPTLPKAQEKVVYVSDSGARTNNGTSPETAVDNLGLAVSMLRENGGTVVVSGELTVKETFLVECADNVTVTSVYGGVDYRETSGAKLLVGGNITLASDLTLENLSIETTASGKSIKCKYNNFTVANGVTCTGVGELSINVGYTIAAGAIDADTVSCHENCTVSVASGTWSLLRGGNQRGTGIHPIGTVDKGVTLTVNISGGTFTYSGVNATAAVGMNGCEGDVYFNISGGTFEGGVYGIHRTGTNSTGTEASFGGNIYMNITGGTFAKTVGLYHTSDTPKVEGEAVITVKEGLQSSINFDGFTKTDIVE